jgi:hypothetical protein
MLDFITNLNVFYSINAFFMKNSANDIKSTLSVTFIKLLKVHLYHFKVK